MHYLLKPNAPSNIIASEKQFQEFSEFFAPKATSTSNPPVVPDGRAKILAMFEEACSRWSSLLAVWGPPPAHSIPSRQPC